jgi:hypothetical protein
MSELFDDEEGKELVAEEEALDAEEIVSESRGKPSADARRRLESLLEEKRLRDELEDYADY